MTSDDDKTPVREVLLIANLDEKPTTEVSVVDPTAPFHHELVPSPDAEPQPEPVPVVTMPAPDDGERVWQPGERALVSLTSSSRLSGKVVTLISLLSNAAQGGVWIVELEGSAERGTIAGSMLLEAPLPAPPAAVSLEPGETSPSSGARGDGAVAHAETAAVVEPQVLVPVRPPAHPDPMDALELDASEAHEQQLAEDHAALAAAESGGSVGGPLTEAGQVKTIGRTFKRVQ